MVSADEALRILEEEHTPADVIEHCKAVAKKAVKMAEKIKASGHAIDVPLVESGALLHDIGRSQSHKIDHCVIGGIILRGRGLAQEARIAETHVGAGLTSTEAKRLGLPPKDYLPKTLEEKLVADADNLVEGSHAIPIWTTVQKYREDGVPEEVVERVIALYHEIESLLASE